MCGSSYEALALAFHESLPDDYPNMVTMPPQEALHSVNDIKNQCPTIENDVHVMQYVEPEKYQIVLFVNSEKPSTWYGFVAISHEKSKDYSTYSLHAELEMVYVRPEFRGMNLGIVMAREVGRLISEGFSSIVEQHERVLSSVFVSVSGLMRKSDYPENTPHLDILLKNNDELIADGGSCVAHPDGSWILEPQCGEEGLYEVDLKISDVFAERQNFDPTGHYSRPDVLKMTINTDRQHTL